MISSDENYESAVACKLSPHIRGGESMVSLQQASMR